MCSKCHVCDVLDKREGVLIIDTFSEKTMQRRSTAVSSVEQAVGSSCGDPDDPMLPDNVKPGRNVFGAVGIARERSHRAGLERLSMEHVSFISCAFHLPKEVHSAILGESQ